MYSFILALSLIGFALGGKVVKLTHNNYNATLAKEPLLLVNYYAPWCGHCKKVSSELSEVAADLKELNIQAKIAQMDVSLTAHARIAEAEQIEGYPTLILYNHGQRLAEYHGGRTHKDILHYLQQKSKPRLQVLHSLADLLSIIHQFENGELQSIGYFSIVLGLFTPPEEEEADGDAASMNGISGPNAALFNSTAEHFDLSLFLITDNPEIRNQLQIQHKGDCMVVFQELPNADHEVLPLNSTTTEASLMRYLLEQALPLTVPYHAAMLPTISYHPVKSHVLMFSASAENNDPFLARMEEISYHYKGRFLFIEVGPEEYHLLNYFGLNKELLPQMIIANMTDPDDLQRYHFSDYLDSIRPRTAQGKFAEATSQVTKHPLDHATAFLDAYLSDTLPRRLNSESVTDVERANEQPAAAFVENIAGTQFEEKVLGENAHNSLVYFHAPWCAHCKSLEPVMSEVGRHYLEDPHFILYRIDGTKNEIALPAITTMRIVGYPTLYFFPAGDKHNPIEYDGNRTVEAVVQFIEAFRTHYRDGNEGIVDTGSEQEERKVGAQDIAGEDVDGTAVVDITGAATTATVGTAAATTSSVTATAVTDTAADTTNGTAEDASSEIAAAPAPEAEAAAGAEEDHVM